MSSAPLRVLHCPENVGGHPSQLAAAERAIGLASRCVTFTPHPFGYPADEVLWPTPPASWRKLTDRFRLARRALTDFDVVHFNFGQTIMPTRPLPGARRGVGVAAGIAAALEMRDAEALRRAGKVVVVTFQGDDARQGDECRRLFDITAATEVESGYYSPETDREKRRRIGLFARVAHRMYALNPDLLNVLPPGARFMPYASVDIADWKPMPFDTTASRPVIVHAPSHRAVKGTKYIVEAVERLRRDGVDVDFRLVEGKSREDARRDYEQAHLLVDQLLIGWYGGLAVECMALGKPVVAYLRESDLGFIPPDMRAALPVIRATPSTVYEVLRQQLAGGLEGLRRAGEASRRYVERFHDAVAVARLHAADYESLLRGSLRAEAV